SRVRSATEWPPALQRRERADWSRGESRVNRAEQQLAGLGAIEGVRGERTLDLRVEIGVGGPRGKATTQNQVDFGLRSQSAGVAGVQSCSERRPRGHIRRHSQSR